MFDWLFGRSKKVDSSNEPGEITKYRTREEALAAAKREIDLLIKEKAKKWTQIDRYVDI